MLRQLITDPYEAIPALVARNHYVVPMSPFLVLGIASSVDRWLRRDVTIGMLASIWIGAVAGAIFLVLYSLWLHLFARAFGGRARALETLRAVGYAMFWPALLHLVAALLRIATRRVDGLDLGSIPSGVKFVASFWSAYLTIVAIRALHSLSWPRAIGVFAAALILLIAIAFGGVLLLR